MSGETLNLKQSKALDTAMSIPVDLSMPCSRVCAATFLCTFFFLGIIYGTRRDRMSSGF